MQLGSQEQQKARWEQSTPRRKGLLAFAEQVRPDSAGRKRLLLLAAVFVPPETFVGIKPMLFGSLRI